MKVTTTPGARVVTFGEIMLRLASADGVRLASARTLDATFGGGEANVAISLARMGIDLRGVRHGTSRQRSRRRRPSFPGRSRR